MTAQRSIFPTEHQEQCNLCEWFHLQYQHLRGCLFAIPNGGERNVIVAARLKAEGVRAGVSDLFLMVPVGKAHGLFIEMKRQRGARPAVSREQATHIQLAIDHGYAAMVCYGFAEAKEAITAYLHDLSN